MTVLKLGFVFNFIINNSHPIYPVATEEYTDMI